MIFGDCGGCCTQTSEAVSSAGVVVGGVDTIRRAGWASSATGGVIPPVSASVHPAGTAGWASPDAYISLSSVGSMATDAPPKAWGILSVGGDMFPKVRHAGKGDGVKVDGAQVTPGMLSFFGTIAHRLGFESTPSSISTCCSVISGGNTSSCCARWKDDHEEDKVG